MSDQFDELARSMAQSVTRRGALKTFGLGLVGIALAALGLANNAEADKRPYMCRCKRPDYGCDVYPNISDCMVFCASPSRCGGGY